MGSRFTAKTWADMICGVLSMIYEMEPVALRKFIPADAGFPGRFFPAKKMAIVSRLGMVSSSTMVAPLVRRSNR